MALALKIESLSKAYQLGQFNTGALSQDIERWWALLRGKEDPFLQIGERNDRATTSDSNVVWSLRDIDLEINKGDTVGVIGKNGAGKSTLLKILSRVTSPTKGSFKVRGRVASLLEVGTGFHPELTGRENIFLNGAILGMRKAEIRHHFDEIVEFAGVARYVDTPVKRYSSGMYVRLAFAVAAHLESEILIVDEVLAVGDAAFQKKCLGKMREISGNDGRTILFVSHNMNSIRTICNRGVLLQDGLVKLDADVESVLREYQSSATSQMAFDTETKLAVRVNRCAASSPNPGHLRFSSIVVKNGEGDAAVDFRAGEKIHLDIDYEVFDRVKGFHIVLQLESAINYSFVTSNRFVITDDALEKGKTGRVSIELEELPLPPGQYLPYFVAMSPDGEAYDVIDRQVLDVPMITIEARSGENNLVEIPSKIKIAQA